MAPVNQAFTKLDKDSLYQLIAMHHNPVSRISIHGFFGEHREKRITALLTQLEKQNKIEKSSKGYRAFEPWADVALAMVGPVSAEKRAKINIVNLPENIKLNISIARSDITKYSLKEGDRVIVTLARGQSGTNDLRARYVAHADKTTPLHLSGHFNAASRVFTTRNYSLQTAFKLSQEPQIDSNHLLVELPQNFDIRNPVLTPLPDQNLDPASGLEISRIVASRHDIALIQPQNILDEAAILVQKPVRMDGRVDLTDLDFVTIDPLGATDLDDALFARVENDGYAFYTAIADVPYLLPYMSAVDREAYNRGLTHYLAEDHIAHMLPTVMSTDKCSLIPNEERAAIVVKQILDRNFQMKAFEIFPAVIVSKEQLSYGQFYDRLDRQDPRFMVMATIHDARRRQGMDKSQQTLLNNSPDRIPTKSIVESAMVQTNSLAAKFLSQASMPFLSRNYSQTPSGYPLKNGTGTRAYYAPFQLGHESLGLTHYAHISSPIRRYGDNINIRALHACFKTPGLGIDAHQIEQLSADAIHLNGRRDTDNQITQEILRYHSIQKAKAMNIVPT